MALYCVLAFLVPGCVGFYYGAMALFHLSPDHEDDVFKILMLGPFAGRRYFTSRGWYCQVLGLILPQIGLALSGSIWFALHFA